MGLGRWSGSSVVIVSWMESPGSYQPRSSSANVKTPRLAMIVVPSADIERRLSSRTLTTRVYWTTSLLGFPVVVVSKRNSARPRDLVASYRSLAWFLAHYSRGSFANDYHLRKVLWIRCLLTKDRDSCNAHNQLHTNQSYGCAVAKVTCAV